MRGRIASAAASLLGHGVVAALLLVGLPWPERSGAVDEGLQGIEVLIAAGGAPGMQAAPPPEPEKPEPEKIVERPVEPPPPSPESETAPEAITSTAVAPDIDTAPKPAPKPKPEPKPRPVAEAPRKSAPEPVQPTAKQMPAPPAETNVAVAPVSPGQSGSRSAPDAGSGTAATSGGNPGAEANYYATLLAWLEQHKEYPRRAQMRRHEGVAHLRFTIDGDGHVLAFRVERSSGHASLDDAVERMIRKAEPLPPIPVALGKERLDLVVPVQFFLK